MVASYREYVFFIYSRTLQRDGLEVSCMQRLVRSGCLSSRFAVRVLHRHAFWWGRSGLQLKHRPRIPSAVRSCRSMVYIAGRRHILYACMHACMYVRMYVCMYVCTYPDPLEDPKSRTPNSGLSYSYGVAYRTLRWIYFLDPSRVWVCGSCRP